MSVESIEYNGIKYAEIIWANTRVEKTTFFSPQSPPFNLACWLTKQDLSSRLTTTSPSPARSTTYSRCLSSSAGLCQCNCIAIVASFCAKS